MLSIKLINTSGGASKYYSKDNYYSKDDGQELSRWAGEGAAALGLEGRVDPAEFKALLEGRLPNGVQLGVLKDGELKHTPGWDLTFSAPKSVSIMALVGRDSQLLEAHERAIDVAMAYMEEHASVTRVVRDGERLYEATGKLVTALFTHDTSRALDPDLHTHAIVLNATLHQDGRWRSLDSQTIYDLKMLGGAIYRAELAREARDIGYEVIQTHSDGRFELAAVPVELMREQSQRRQTIERKLEESFVKDAKTAAHLANITRERKTEVNRDNLLQVWRDQANAHGFDARAAVPQIAAERDMDGGWLNSLITGEAKLTPISLAQGLRADEMGRGADDAVKYASDKLAERTAVFETHDLAKETIQGAIGVVGYKSIEAAIERAVERKELLPALLGDKPAWTTPEALKLETENLRMVTEGRGAIEPILPDRPTAQIMLSGKGLNPGQFAAAELILTTTDRFVAVQGFAGTGKTFMLNAVREVSGHKVVDVYGKQRHDINLVGAAPSSAAANLIKDDAKIESMSVAKLLAVLNSDMRTARASGEMLRRDGEVWVIDESSMVSTRAGHELQKKAIQTGARVVWIGDQHQLPSVEAGKFFAQILESGVIKFEKMTTIVRQKNETLRDAVYDMYRKLEPETFAKATDKPQGSVGAAAAFDRLKDRIQVFGKDNEGLLTAVAQQYLKLADTGRSGTLIAIPTNEDRLFVNQLIREGLVKEGKIGNAGESVHTDLLNARGLTAVETKRAVSYEVGNVVRFNEDYTRSLGIKKDEYLRVIDRNVTGNQVQLLHDDGRKIDWFPHRQGGGTNNGVTVYKVETRVLAAGDQLIWRRNEEKAGRYNAETAKVVAVSSAKKTATVRLKDGSVKVLNLAKRSDQHWDYAWARTVHSLQGATEKSAFLVVQSWRKLAVNYKSALVELSRPKYDVRIFMDDFGKVIKALDSSERSGNKASARDSVRDYEKQRAKEAMKAVENAKRMDLMAQKVTDQQMRNGLKKSGEVENSKVKEASQLHKKVRGVDSNGLVKTPALDTGSVRTREQMAKAAKLRDKPLER